MSSPIHLDANVFVYSGGRDHPLRDPSMRVLALASGNAAFFTDAEVFQEILHRYVLLRRWEKMRPLFESFVALLTGRTEPLIADDVVSAGELAQTYDSLSARDLIHIAIMQRVGSRHIVTADRGFDRIDGITRLDPARVGEWQALVEGN